MASWTKDRVFGSGKEFVTWLDKNYGNYVSKSINSTHMHHTWSPNHNTKGTTLQLHKNMRNYHVNTNGWQDIAQHISIGKDGKVVLGRNINTMPASASGYNGSASSHPFMFETIGNFDRGHDRLQGKQLETVLAITKYLHVTKGKKLKFHNEMTNVKSCPGSGIDKAQFVKQVESYKGGKAETPSAPSGSSGKDNTGSGGKGRNYLQVGDKGSEVKSMQNRLIKAGYKLPKFGADGHFGEESRLAVVALQKNNGLNTDGLFGVLSSDVLDKEVSGKNTSSKSKWTSVSGDWTGQTLKNGQQGKPVRQLQNKLAKNNPPFYPNKNAKNNGVDGYYGKDTEDAVRRFQTYYGLGKDGLAGKEVYGKLGGAKTVKKKSKKKKYTLPTGVYSQKAHGGKKLTAVKQIQKALNAANFKVGKADGYYGKKTTDAVKRFQSVYIAHEVDGIYGNNVRKALDKQVN